MKKIELKSLAEYFGSKVPAGRIEDREVRLDIVRLYASLVSAYKGVIDEIEAVRKSLVGDKGEEIAKYGELRMKMDNQSLSEEEREKARKEAETMEDCIRIDKDFQEAAGKIYSEDIEVKVRKVSLEVLYEALCDCDFPNLNPDIPIAAVAAEFAPVIKEE